MKNYVDAEKLQEYTTKLVAKLKEIFPGPAQAASTVAEMTDESKVYVYTGSETGYTAGNWYYWDGTAWTSGGVYNAVQIETDTTLTETGEAADAKATGDAIAAAKAAVLADLAPAYSTSATYSVGAYVVYNGGLYRCITAISTAEAWTAAHWTAVNLANDVGASLADLKSAIIEDINRIVTISPNMTDETKRTAGYIYYSTGTVVNNANFSTSDYIRVNTGATYVKWLNRPGGLGADAVYIASYRLDKTYIGRITGTELDTGWYSYTIPSGVSYIRFSTAGNDLTVTNCYFGLGNAIISSFPPYGFSINSDGTIDYSQIKNAPDYYDYTLYDGYIGLDGTITEPTVSLEKYTDQITIPATGNIGCSLQYSQSRSMWLCYALYDSNGDFLGRTVLASENRQTYNGIVSIANKNAVFIRFSFRGFNDFKFAAYNPITYSLDNISSETDKIKSDIGVYEITFDVTASSSHSSNDDQMPVNIKADEVYHVYVTSTAITGGQIYVVYTDGTSERVYSGNDLNQVFTASKDIVKIALYIGAAFVTATGKVTVTAEICGYAMTINGVDANYCANVKSINHRGFTLAPENTLPAFKLSRKMGFTHVETDILWTSDNVPVLLHDTTINRTARNADGTTISDTISIADITYEQALTYDFGIYKGTQYAGTKIPTFTEFIILCKQLGLNPYVELKGGSQEQINGLVDITDRYGMTDNVTWISFYTEFLSRVKTRYAKARLGFVVDTIDSSKITEAAALKTSDNDVFIDTDYTHVTTAIVEACVAADMPLEVYTIDSISALVGLDAYISGYTSNKLIASKVLYDANIS